MSMRFRSKSTPFAPNLSHVTTWPDGSPYLSQGSPASHTLLETMNDLVSPGYFASQRRGQFLPINPMDQKKTIIEVATSGQVKYDVKYNGTLSTITTLDGHLAVHGHVHHFGAAFPPSYTGSNPSWPDTSVLVTEALANARTRGFDILTFLVEFRKTVELIARFRTRVLKRAEDIADAISNGDFDSIAEALAEFSAVWLEGRYGWRILAYDMEAITEAVYKLNQAKPPFIRGYASEEALESSSILNYSSPSTYLRRYTPYYSNAAVHMPATFVIEQSKVREVRAGVVLEALLDDVLSINPLLTAWEVVPFSFILDWFVNIGDTIAAFSPSVQENLLGAWSKQTEKIVTTTTLSPVTMGNPSSGWYYELQGSTEPFLFEIQEIESERMTESPSASLSWRLNLDELKLVDLASIFLARWGKILGGIVKSTRI